MKKLIFILLIFFACQSQAQIKLIPPADKNLHFTVSAGLSSIFFLAVYNYTGNEKLATWVSLGAVGILAITKELIDSKTTGFSGADLAYDMAGWGAVIGGFRIVININNKP